MPFKLWLRKVFGPKVRGSRPSRRSKPRQRPRSRFAPWLEILEDRLAPAILMVTNTNDSGTGSLRDAIIASVNRTSDGLGQTGTANDTIQFSSAMNGQTINLTSYSNDLSKGSQEAGPSAFYLDNQDTLTIDGQTGLTKGITIERSTASSTANFRLFDVAAGSSLTLKNLTLENGEAQGFDGANADGMNGAGCGSAGLGGAIFNQGTLTILNSTLSGNTSQGGSGGTGDTGGGTGGGGAGLGQNGSSGDGDSGGNGGGPNAGAGGYDTLTLDDSSGPGGFGGGGGGSGFFEVDVGEDDFIHSTPGGGGGFGGGGGGGGTEMSSLGHAGGQGGFGGGGGGGGGRHHPVGAVGITAYNWNPSPGSGGFGGGNGASNAGGGGAGMGGAVFNYRGHVYLTNSTVYGNTANGGAGGKDSWTRPVFGGNVAYSYSGQAGKGYGGGLFTLNGTITITSSTISQNTAAQGGRGIDVYWNSASASAAINNTIIGQSDTKGV